MQYPPGVPAWLLVIRWTLGEGLNQIQAAHLVLLALTAMLVGDALRRLGHAWLGVAAMGAVVLNPMLQYYAGTMLSESLYTFWGVATVWALLRAAGSKSPWWVGLAIASAMAGFLTRTVGLALVAGVGASLLWRGRWRMLAMHAALALVVVAGWFRYVSTRGAGSLSHTYALDMASAQGYGEVATILHRILGAIGFYVRYSVPDLLGLPLVAGSVVDNVAVTLIIGTCALVGFVILIRRWEAVPLVLAATIGILLVWPWPTSRLSVPLIPLAIPTILLGASALGGRLGGAWGRAGASIAIALVLILVGLWRDTNAVARLAGCPRGTLYATESPCNTAEQRSLVAGAILAGQYLPPGEAVATHIGPVVYYFGGRRTVPAEFLQPHPGGDGTEWWAAVGAGYLLVTAFRPRTASDLLPGCARLQVVGRAEPAAVLLAPGKTGSPEGNACEVLAWVVRQSAIAPP